MPSPGAAAAAARRDKKLGSAAKQAMDRSTALTAMLSLLKDMVGLHRPEAVAAAAHRVAAAFRDTPAPIHSLNAPGKRLAAVMVVVRQFAATPSAD